MTLTYDPTGHPLLSAAAQKLHVQGLLAHGQMAEELLGLRGVSLGTDDSEVATLAVTLQVNLQVRMPEDFGMIAAEKKGDQSIEWRGPDEFASAPIDPTAEKIADRLLGDENWATLRSLR